MQAFFRFFDDIGGCADCKIFFLFAAALSQRFAKLVTQDLISLLSQHRSFFEPRGIFSFGKNCEKAKILSRSGRSKRVDFALFRDDIHALRFHQWKAHALRVQTDLEDTIFLLNDNFVGFVHRIQQDGLLRQIPRNALDKRQKLPSFQTADHEHAFLLGNDFFERAFFFDLLDLIDAVFSLLREIQEQITDFKLPRCRSQRIAFF